MILKRIGSIGDPRSRQCFRCGYGMEGLKDGTEYECRHCGQKYFVDINGKKLVLTVAERPGLRDGSRREHLEKAVPTKKEQAEFRKGLEAFWKKWKRYDNEC